MDHNRALITPMDTNWLAMSSTRVHYNFFEVNRALREARRVVHQNNNENIKPSPKYKRARIEYKVNPEYVKITRSMVKKETQVLEVESSPMSKNVWLVSKKSDVLFMAKFNKEISSIESLIKSIKTADVCPIDILTSMRIKLKTLTASLDQEIANARQARYTDNTNDKENKEGERPVDEVLRRVTPLLIDMGELQDLPPVVDVCDAGIGKTKGKLDEVVCDDDTIEVDDSSDDENDEDEEEYNSPLTQAEITSLPTMYAIEKTNNEIVEMESYETA